MEQTKLSVFCDKVMEAGWLLAAIMAPLFFDVYSSRVFEPDKITLIRSLAVIMSAAWLIKVLDSGLGMRGRAPLPAARSGPKPVVCSASPSRNALAWPTLLLVSAYLISTIFSVSQVVSLWGSYQRLQGTYSTFSYIVIFALLVATMRRREQVERLITIMLFTSLPASLYGLVQHNKLEFLPWAGDVTTRVTSSMGNAIFIAAWLIMVVPLALARYLDAAYAAVDRPGLPGGQARTSRSPVRPGRHLSTMQGVAASSCSSSSCFASTPPARSTGRGRRLPRRRAGRALPLGAIILPFFLGIAAAITWSSASPPTCSS